MLVFVPNQRVCKAEELVEKKRPSHARSVKNSIWINSWTEQTYSYLTLFQFKTLP